VGWLEKQTAQVVQELILNRLDVVVSANFNGPLSSEADYPLGGWDEVAGAERIRKLLEGDSYTEIKPVGGNSGEHRDQWCHEFVRLGQFKNVAAFVVTPDKVGLTALMKGLGGFPTRCVNNFWEALRLSERQTITMGEEATYTMDAMVRRQNALLALVQEAFQSMDPQDAIARIESGSWASWDQIEQS
jgi:hypothetical protein